MRNIITLIVNMFGAHAAERDTARWLRDVVNEDRAAMQIAAESPSVTVRPFTAEEWRNL